MRLIFTLTFCLAFGFSSITYCQMTTIDFDTNGNWTAGSGGLTSYQSDHSHVSDNWIFTGGPALRDGTSAQDGFPKALGTYSWRIRDNSASLLIATYNNPAARSISQVGFSARRWDASPSVNYTVQVSTDGGMSYATIVNIDNAALGNTSNWQTFSYTFPVPVNVSAGDVIVQFDRNGGERLFVDDFTFTDDVVLPVSLSNFEAESSYNSVNLSWATASEINNDHFEVQHSIDGRSYETLDIITGFGTSNENRSYDFEHKNVKAGNHYYQLKQVDFDGRSEIFGPVHATVKGSRADFKPTSIDQTIYFANDLIGSNYAIYNTAGSTIQSGIVTKQIDASNINSGIYFLRVNNATHKIIKM